MLKMQPIPSYFSHFFFSHAFLAIGEFLSASVLTSAESTPPRQAVEPECKLLGTCFVSVRLRSIRKRAKTCCLGKYVLLSVPRKP